jgi:hypothetical protein
VFDLLGLLLFQALLLSRCLLLGLTEKRNE